MRPKRTCLALAVVCVAWLSAWPQENSEQKQEEKPPAKRPTLGPSSAPSLSGPRTSTTTDPRKLLRVRSVYIERMDNSLSDKLTEAMARTGRFRLVSTRNEADAVMHGTCFDSRRLKTVHSEVYLSERSSRAPIWQDSVRRPVNPPPLDTAVTETAQIILEHLSASVLEAERR